MTSIDAVLAHLDADAPQALERLKAFLRIPSVSTDPKYALDVKRAAEWVAATLGDCGLDAQIRPTQGHPVVLARTRPEAAPAHAPRVLFYGHYDVQPPDPLELWTSPPFEPTIRDGKIYARGAEDDKGQISTFFEALRAWAAAAGGRFPAHVTVLIEGEEECGSANLKPFLEAHRDELAAPKHDFVLICDTGMWEGADTDRRARYGGGVPAITYGLRGLAYFDVQLHGPGRDLHSGVYGGTLANPANLLVEVLGRLFDADRRVTIPGFYDDVVELTPEERERWSKLGFEERQFLGEVGVERPFGEAGYDTMQRRVGRPSCDINGLYGGYQGPGAKTVLPSFAGAKVSFRLAPDQRPATVAAAFERWLRSHDVGGCRWQITDLHGAEPALTPTDSPWIGAARRAFARTAGREPVLMREGATIPVVADFKSVLGLDSVLLGFGLSDDAIHSPNEKYNLDCFELGCRTHAALLGELAAAKR